MAVVKLEGQDIPLDDAIAAGDDLIRKALSPFYPDVANAEIKRETKDGQVVVTVVKRAGPKGSCDGRRAARLPTLSHWFHRCRPASC